MEDLSCESLDAVRGKNHPDHTYLPEAVPEQVQGVGPEDTEEVMDMLADMHAHYWGRREEGVADWALPWQSKAFLVTAPMVISDAVKSVPKVWSEITGEQIPQSFMQTAEVYKTLADRLYSPENSWIQGGPMTLIHGDCRRNNMVYVQRKGQDAKLHFIDFQMIRWARGEDDIAYYIFSSLKDPLSHWEGLLRRYHTGLCQILEASGKMPIDGYSFEQCVFNFWCGMVWETLTIFLVMSKNADLEKGDAALLMEKYGRSFFSAQEQCDFSRLMQLMLDPKTFENGFDTKALWECMKRPLKTVAPKSSL